MATIGIFCSVLKMRLHEHYDEKVRDGRGEQLLTMTNVGIGNVTSARRRRTHASRLSSSVEEGDQKALRGPLQRDDRGPCCGIGMSQKQVTVDTWGADGRQAYLGCH